MRASSPGSDRRGTTLIELVIVTGILSVMLSAMCGIYLLIQIEYRRQSAAEQCRMAAALALSDIASVVEAAHSVSVISRRTSNDTLIIYRPLDQAYGIPVPVEPGNAYRKNNWSPLCLYLSNSTGNYNTQGNILWLGRSGPYGVEPDQTWGLHPGTTSGRISPVQALSFTVDNTGYRPKVTVSLQFNRRLGGVSASYPMYQVISLRNSGN